MKPRLNNRDARAAIARRMAREHGELLRDNAQEDHFLRRLVREHVLGVLLVAAAAGALAWYRGGTPTTWQLAAFAGLLVGVPIARWWVRKRAHA